MKKIHEYVPAATYGKNIPGNVISDEDEDREKAKALTEKQKCKKIRIILKNKK